MRLIRFAAAAAASFLAAGLLGGVFAGQSLACG